jgi:L-alanine-DL-glutamate epimerase-like enolase superfamily enzyme
MPVRWPLRRTFVTSLGAKSSTDNVVVKARLSGGAVGYGEASSSLAMAFQTQALMATALRRLAHDFQGRDVRGMDVLLKEAWEREGRWPAAVAAFETALWDALARAEGIPFYGLWGGSRRRLTTLLTISAVSPEEVFGLVRDAFRRGFKSLKLKLNGRLLLDANQSFRPEPLATLLDQIHQDGIAIELIEEPFPKRNWKMLEGLRGSRVPVLLDESIQNPSDARRVVSDRLARGVNIKLAKSGLVKSQEILNEFRAKRQIKAPITLRSSPSASLFMIGCMAESKIGLSAAVHFACGLGVFDYVDLDSDLLLKEVKCRGGYIRRGPEVALPKRPPAGLGIAWPV